jgi:BirA family biotin operon repressor/biotin-[acetyl-CoA-carboxylase] ligase
MNPEDQEEALFGLVKWAESLPSTNTELLRRVSEGEDLQAGQILAVRHQTAGRGRQQRAWQSGADQDLTFSFFWPFEPPERMVSLPMAVALAVADLLTGYGIQADTKWPNDVLVGGQKICGLLAEMATDAAGQATGLVVGVGLNVNMSATAAAAIDRPATSMQILTGKTYRVTAILDRLLPLLEARLAQWSADGFPAIRSDWLSHAVWMHRAVELHTDSGPLAGVLRGYGEHGELLLEVDGEPREVWSAELMRSIG